MSQQPPFNPNLPQAGWYDDPEHPQMIRWWDGTQWTPHRKPAQPSIPAMDARPAGRRSGKSWPRQHKVLTAFGAVAAFWLIVIVAAVASHGSGPAASTAAQAPQTSAAAVSSPSAASSSPAAAAPAAVRTVATFSGSGTENTPQFTVSDTWKLDYTFSCAAFGQSGNFQVFEDGGSDFNGVTVNELSDGQSGSTWAYGDAGTHYLVVNSECSWTVKVIDEP
jgi:hypothetical protein